MKAMVLTAPEELVLNEVAQPRLDTSRVLVRVTHSGVCGTDYKIYTGAIPVRHPLIMGHEMAGEVVESDADALRPGDRVIVDPELYCGACFYCRAGQNNLCPNGVLLGRDADGGFAEYVVAPPSHVFPLSKEIDNQTAPLIQVLTTCLHAQRRLDIFPGESVVVVGLGVTGQVHVQLAKARGAYPVIGIEPNAWRRGVAEKLGADVTLPPGEASIQSVLQATNGRGADLVIEATGIGSAIAEGIAMARLGARLLLFGITTATEVRWPFYQLYFKELTLFSSRAAKSEDYPSSIDLVARGVVQLKPLVSDVMPLGELKTAIGMLVSDSAQRMKIILEHEVK